MELWAIALIWLTWRLWTVFSTPIEILKSILRQIPTLLPDFTVDQLGHEWAAVRWRYPAHARHASRHLLEVLCIKTNLKEVFETERGQTRMLLQNLCPDTEYSVTLYAQPGRRLAGQILFNTYESDGENAPITEWSEPHTSHPKSNVNGPQKSIQQVKEEIERLQAEFSHEFEMRQQASAEFKASQFKLNAQLEEAASTRKSEQAARAHQRAEIKSLEDTKHSLDIKRKNETKKNRELQNLMNVQHSTQNRWATELGEMRARLNNKTKQEASDRANWQEQCGKLQARVDASANDLSRLDQSIKRATADLKSAEIDKRRCNGLIKSLEKHTDITTSLLSPSFALPSDISYSEEERQLIDAFEKDTSIEDEWTTLQQALERRYVAAYQQHEQANRALENAQARAHAQTKAQAQLYANAFSSSSLNVPSQRQTTTPVVSELLPSYLFAEDRTVPAKGQSGTTSPRAAMPAAPRTPVTGHVTHLPPSPQIVPGTQQFGYPSWKPASNRSRESSIFFSANGSINDESRSSFDNGSVLAGSAFDATIEEDILGTPRAADVSASSPTSSPEKSRWGLLGKKPTPSTPKSVTLKDVTAPSATSNFVRRLSFFRKDKGEDATDGS